LKKTGSGKLNHFSFAKIEERGSLWSKSITRQHKKTDDHPAAQPTPQGQIGYGRPSKKILGKKERRWLKR
jgi:hypothetical protein